MGIFCQCSSHGLWFKNIYGKMRGVWETECRTKARNRKDREGFAETVNVICPETK